MKTKRILFVTDFYNPYNGMGKFIIDISKIFKKNNFQVIILTAKTEGNLNKVERDNGIIIFRSPISFKFSRGYFSFSLIKDFLSLQKKVDIIYFHFPLVELLPLVLLSNKTKILHYHCLPPFVLNDFKFIIANVYFTISIFFSMFFCDKIITFTNDYFFSKKINKIFKNKTFEIFPFIKSENNIVNLNEKILENNIIPILGFLGRICEEKGLENIVESSKILDSKNILHKILIAGDINDKRFKKNIAKILSLAKDAKSVKFIGKLTDKEKLNFFHKIHILLLPSTNSFEAFGLVQLEAMNFGKLVIASDISGVRVPIKLTRNGCLTKIKNSNDLAMNILKCIEMAKIKSKKEVLDSYYKSFNYDDSLTKYLSIFSRI